MSDSDSMTTKEKECEILKQVKEAELSDRVTLKESVIASTSKKKDDTNDPKTSELTTENKPEEDPTEIGADVAKSIIFDVDNNIFLTTNSSENIHLNEMQCLSHITDKDTTDNEIGDKHEIVTNIQNLDEPQQQTDQIIGNLSYNLHSINITNEIPPNLQTTNSLIRIDNVVVKQPIQNRKANDMAIVHSRGKKHGKGKVGDFHKGKSKADGMKGNLHSKDISKKANTSTVHEINVNRTDLIDVDLMYKSKNSKSSDSKDKQETIISKSEKPTIHESITSVGSNICRICMTAGKERLIKPCNCKGSMGSVHLSCLERWLNQVGRNYCELCGYCYPSIRTPRYTLFESLRIWFSSPRNRVHFQSDCMIFWLLTTVTAGLLAVCIMGTHYFTGNTNNMKPSKTGHPHPSSNMSSRVTETAMNFFMAVVFSGYLFTVYLLWKDHYVTWKRWRRANVNVRLLISDNHQNV